MTLFGGTMKRIASSRFFWVHSLKIVCAMALLLGVLGFRPDQFAFANSTVTIDFETLMNVPTELRQPISDAVNNVAAATLPEDHLLVSTVNRSENWAYAILVAARIVDAHWENISDSGIVEVLANRQVDGRWVAFVKGTPGFLQLAQSAPRTWMDFSYLTNSSSISQNALNATQPVEYLFPWTAGQDWYKTQGWHDNSLDFQPVPRSDPSTHFAVLAAAEGVMTISCVNDPYQTQVRITHPDGGSTYYLHLDTNTVRYDLVGKSIARGQFLGLLYNGTQGGHWNNTGTVYYQYDTKCGYGTAVHLHFGAPKNITINQYAINTVADSNFATRYRSSNVRIDDLNVPGWLSTDVHVAGDQTFSMARWATQQGGYWDSQRWFTGDFNGDGKTDFAKIFDDGNSTASIDVHLSNASKFDMVRWATQQGGYWGSQRWFTGDFNGDGKTDFAKIFDNGNSTASIDVHLSNGSKFDMVRWATQQGGYWDTQDWFTGDFNGDGKTDFAKIFDDANSTASIDVHVSDGSKFNMVRWATRQGGYWETQRWFTGDFNGDGKTDFAKIFDDANSTASIDVHVSDGSKFDMVRWATRQGGYWETQRWFTGDFNGDGKTDFAKIFDDANSTASIDVHVSAGSKFDMVRWATRQGGYWETQRWFTGDFNGDGKTDFAKIFDDANSTASIDVHVSAVSRFDMVRWATRQGGYWETQRWFTGDFNGDGKTDFAKFWKDIGPIVNNVASTGAVIATPYSLVEMSAGTFTAPVNFTQSIRFASSIPLPGTLKGLNRFYESSAVYASSLQPAVPTQSYKLTVKYSEADVRGFNEATLALYYWNGFKWVKEPSSTLDQANNLVSAMPQVLGQWTIMGDRSWHVFLPVAKR
jgi:hypothetical protein